MSKNKCHIGIDTSNYKTSVAAVSGDGILIFERSEFLEVEAGARGLRQSTAFFMHVKRLPDLVREMFEAIEGEDVLSVSVSYAPRRTEGSYMPVFLAGQSTAKSISAALGVPCFEFSHQEGHIESAVFSCGTEVPDRFAFFHLSGGTTEYLICERSDEGISAEIVGGSRDISIGQLLDRVGVKAGFPFPAGRYLDEIASSAGAAEKLPSKIKFNDGYFNLSGIESEIMRNMERGEGPDASGIFSRISDLLYDSAVWISRKYDLDVVYMAGGVGASRRIRRDMAEKSGPGSPDIRFASPELSGDNAVGTALLGRRTYERGF